MGLELGVTMGAASRLAVILIWGVGLELSFGQAVSHSYELWTGSRVAWEGVDLDLDHAILVIVRATDTFHIDIVLNAVRLVYVQGLDGKG